MAGNTDWLLRPFAHRGLHDADGGILENMPSAFQAAIDANYGIELDVQPSSDSEIIVFHDETLDRLTHASGPTSSRTASQLKKVRFKKTTDRMQTLSELLEQVGGKVPILVEIKSDWRERGPVEQKVARLLQNYRGQFAVMSFDPRSVAAFADAAPEETRGLIAESYRHGHGARALTQWQRFYMRHLLSSFIAKPHFINYDIRALPSPAPWLWRTILRRPLLVWTVRTRSEQERAKRWADSIIFEQIRP